MTIAANVCLSLYRIHDSRFNLALFIAFSVVNSVYCCESPSPFYVSLTMY